jgi:putative flippase GtrA
MAKLKELAPQKPTQQAQVLWFIAVGAAASAVHLGVVVALVQWASLQPLVANIFGWLIAFSVSFAGHYALTFKHSGVKIFTAFRRFFAISFLGFCINELAYAVAISMRIAHYAVSLFSVLLGVAAMTFYLSRRWAFFKY